MNLTFRNVHKKKKISLTCTVTFKNPINSGAVNLKCLSDKCEVGGTVMEVVVIEFMLDIFRIVALEFMLDIYFF